MTTLERCKCSETKLLFKKYDFVNNRVAYKGTCTTCGLVRGWYEGKNYKLVVGTVLSDNTPKGGGKTNR